MTKFFKLMKNTFYLGVGIVLLPVLAPVFLVYLVFLILSSSVEMSFKICLRLIFPPLLILDLWKIISD